MLEVLLTILVGFAELVIVEGVPILPPVIDCSFDLMDFIDSVV